MVNTQDNTIIVNSKMITLEMESGDLRITYLQITEINYPRGKGFFGGWTKLSLYIKYDIQAPFKKKHILILKTIYMQVQYKYFKTVQRKKNIKRNHKTSSGYTK